MEITGAKRPALKNSTIGATYKARKDEEARSWADLNYWVKKFRFYPTGHGEPSKTMRYRYNPALVHLLFKWSILEGVGRNDFR